MYIFQRLNTLGFEFLFIIIFFLSFTGTIKDKIFTGSGKDVRGYTKKGKLFLNFDTNLTEPITSLSITGSHLLT